MAARGRRNKRPGRKSDPEAKSRQTTRVGRAFDRAPDFGAVRYLAQLIERGGYVVDQRHLPAEVKALAAQADALRGDLDAAIRRRECSGEDDPDSVAAAISAIARLAREARRAKEAALQGAAIAAYQAKPFELTEFIARSARQTATTRTDLPDTPLAALHGRGVLGTAAYAAGLYYQSITEIWRRGAGLNQASCEAVYRRLIAGSVEEAQRYLSGDVDRPTTADRARVEVGYYDSHLAPGRLSLVRGIVAGEWPRCVVAMRSGDAVFWPPRDAPLTLIGGQINDRNLRALAEIADDFGILASIDPSPRLRQASLAA